MHINVHAEEIKTPMIRTGYISSRETGKIYFELEIKLGEFNVLAFYSKKPQDLMEFFNMINYRLAGVIKAEEEK